MSSLLYPNTNSMIIYRYLLAQYVKVFLFCVGSFIAILLTTRLDEIAHFIALGAKTPSIVWFCLYQIPYILPIVIPISCLISAIVLVQRLSTDQELTAMRASGFSLQEIFAPILITAAFLSLANFYIVSELATESKLAARRLEHDLRSINPLLLLQNKHLSKLNDIYIDANKGTSGDHARDLILAVWDHRSQRINLINAKHLGGEEATLYGEEVAFIGGIKAQNSNSYDHLIMENIHYLQSSFEDFSQSLKKSVWRLKHHDYLKMSLLIYHIQQETQKLMNFKKLDDPLKIHEISKGIAAGFSEISRRISIALAVFTFTLMGVTFGIHISRSRSRKGIYAAVILATLFLISFFIAKGLETKFVISTSLYLLPHLIIVLSSVFALSRVSKGIGS